MKMEEKTCFLSRKGFSKLSYDKDLTGETYRIWFYLIGKTDALNSVKETQQEIADALGINVLEVYRAINLFFKKEMLTKSESGSFVLSGDYVWPGFP